MYLPLHTRTFVSLKSLPEALKNIKVPGLQLRRFWPWQRARLQRSSSHWQALVGRTAPRLPQPDPWHSANSTGWTRFPTFSNIFPNLHPQKIFNMKILFLGFPN